MSTIARISRHWHGFLNVTRLVIFGDSYSDIGYDHAREVPDCGNPLGTKFPGITWNEEDEPNWVGHLITKYCPHPRYNPARSEQSEAYRNHTLLVYNYAQGGHTVAGVRSQIQCEFLPKVGKKPQWARWDADDSLFVTWVGINDCAFSRDHTALFEGYLKLQDDLYKAGARNFLFIDVPPVYRRLNGRHTFIVENSKNSIENWNLTLRSSIEKFSLSHEDATVLLYSSFKAFDDLLNNPVQHGFNAEDVVRSGGAIWVDHIHPSTRVHDIIAKDIADFLGTVVKPVLD